MVAQTLKIAFLCSRLNSLRVLGPIAAAASHRGWRGLFVCPSGGPKDDAADSLAQIESEGGWPAMKTNGTTETTDLLVSHRVDAVVSVGLRVPPWISRHVMPITRARGIRWCSVGYLSEELLQVLEDGPAILGDWDVVTTGSWEAVDWCAEQLATLRSRAAGAEAWRRFVAVGYPALDPLTTLDRAACRKKYGLSDGERMLLFVPAARPHLMPRWRHEVFRGALQWLAPVLGLPTYREIAMAVSTYARRHGATVIVKTRAKNPDPSWLNRIGRVIGDISWYPHTALELEVAADAYCGFASGMALEATAAGLPQTHFFAWPPSASEHPLFLPFRERYWINAGPWNYAGVSKPLWLFADPRQVKAWAGKASWPSRPSTADSHAALQAITGIVDGKAADRVLDAIERVPR